MASLKSNTIYNFILSLGNAIFPLIATPYVSRVLNIEDIGLINSGMVYAALVINLFSFGFANYGAREVARVKDDSFKLNKVFSRVLGSHIFVTIIGLFIYLLSINYFADSESEHVIYTLYAIFILTSTLKIEWLYFGLERFRYISIRSLIVRFLVLVLLFLTVTSQEDYIVYGCLAILAQSLNSVCNLWHSRKYVKFKLTFIKLISFKKLCFSARFFYLQTLVAICYQSVNLVILSDDPVELALFVRAMLLASLIVIFTNPLLGAIKPRLEGVIGRDKEQYRGYIEQAATLFFMLIFPMCVGMATLSYDIMYLFGGEQFVSGYIILVILSIVMFFSQFSAFLNQLISTPAGFEKNTFHSNSFVACISIVANPVLIYYFGSFGAALALLISEFCGTFAHFVLVRRQSLYLDWLNKNKLKYFLSSLMIVPFVFIINGLVDNIYMHLFLSVTISVVVYFTSLFFISRVSKDVEDLNWLVGMLIRRFN